MDYRYRRRHFASIKNGNILYSESAFWIVFIVLALTIIIVDLYVTEHRHGKIGLKKSIIWSAIWVATALLFCAGIYFFVENGHQKSLEFLTGYLIEYSLSIDNLFVFLLIFRVMQVPTEHQPHVLKWGILSAVVFRIAFILIGVGLINLFHPIIYVFGTILLFASYNMMFGGEKKIDYERNPLVRLLKNYFKFIPEFKGKKFFFKKDGKRYATAMFLTLILIESSDIVFAVDSIPAVIAITRDEFIIITSNIFAILGLRSLYFALSGIVDMFIYLKYGVGMILAFVGFKMLLSEVIEIPVLLSLAVIASLLVGSIILSLIKKKE